MRWFAVLVLALGLGVISAGCSDEVLELPTAIIEPSSIDAEVGEWVQLDGSASTDPAGRPLTYLWDFESVPVESALDAASFNDRTTATPSFLPDAVGTYKVTLVVSNGENLSSPASASVNVSRGPQPPLVKAIRWNPPDPSVGDLVRLSSDVDDPNDGAIFAYSWTLQSKPEGSIAELNETALASPSFVADIAGTYGIRVVVVDETGLSSEAAFAFIVVVECPEGQGRCSSDGMAIETCENGEWNTAPCGQDQACAVVNNTVMCIGGSGGTGGTGGTAGNGGMGGTPGSGGMPGSGGTGGTNGSSCAEADIGGLPQLAGTLILSDDFAVPDQFIHVTADVDPDTEELTATILNESSGFPGGSCFVLTSGNETVECDLRVETVAEPGRHVLNVELRADPSNRLDYVLYRPGDGDRYVRIEFENNVPGAEAATTCLQRTVTIQF